MITRLLLAIDDTPSSRQAQALGLALARAHKAAIEGLAIVDTAWIFRPQAVGVGGTAYRVHAEETELRAARREAGAAAEALRQEMAAAGIEGFVRVEEGAPVGVIATASVACDLITLGHDARFWGDGASDVSRIAADLLRNDPRPVLLAATRPPAGEALLVTFDGSVASSRALHMLALLGLAAGRRVRVLSIDADLAVAGRRAEQAAQLLRAHGAMGAEAVSLAPTAPPAEMIMAQAAEIDAGLLSMGAYGHTGLKELLFGSTTRTLLRQEGMNLFLHH